MPVSSHGSMTVQMHFYGKNLFSSIKEERKINDAAQSYAAFFILFSSLCFLSCKLQNIHTSLQMYKCILIQKDELTSLIELCEHVDMCNPIPQ